MSLFTPEQIIIVTGASSGIGLACAQTFVKEGATIIATARDEERLKLARKESEYPQRWHNEPCDLAARLKELPLWLGELRKKYGRFWGLLHAAGAGRLTSLSAMDLEEARADLEINFLVPLQIAKGFSDRRNYQKGGCMVFISSISALYPEKCHVTYGAAKAALAVAVKAISHETFARGLRANCISPAQVLTPMLEAAFDNMGDSYRLREEARYPNGFGKPEDVASLACFLLSNKASWLTGQNFPLTGGAY